MINTIIQLIKRCFGVNQNFDTDDVWTDNDIDSIY